MKKAALLGCGVVGGGVAAIMQENAAYLETSVGEPVELKYILELRDCSGEPWANKAVKDFSVIESDPEISVVAECIGGVGVAYDFVKRALLAGKSAVTSNKQLIAEKGLELLSIAKEKGVFLLFEASVGGGIPLLRPVMNALTADRLESVTGILNGTTNYILTRMDADGVSFDCVLIRRDALELTGGIMDMLPSIYCDMDICLQFKHSGFKVVVDPRVCVEVRSSRAPGEVEENRARLIMRERWGEVLKDGGIFYNPNFKRDSARFELL